MDRVENFRELNRALCFPWFHPYSSHKLNHKFNHCVFLDYSLTQSSFLYFHPTLKKNVSIHIKFVENVFLFASLSTSTTPIIDTTSTLPASSFPLYDYLALSPPPPPPPPYPLCRAHLNCSLHHQHPTRPPADLHPRPHLHHSSGLLYLLACWVRPPSHHQLVSLPHLTFIPCKLALKMSSSNTTRNMASPPSFLLSLGTSLHGM